MHLKHSNTYFIPMITFNDTTQHNKYIKMNHLNANSQLMMAIRDHMD